MSDDDQHRGVPPSAASGPLAATGPLAAMASLAYRRLFYCTAIVVFGVMGQAVARGWLARELTGSNAGLGGVMLVFGGALLFATPFGGVAADRYAKRTVLLASVGALVVSSTAVGLAVVADVMQYWLLLLASAVQAAAFAFFLPARIALISEVVPAVALRSAIVVAQMAQEATRVVGPALAGVLIGVTWFGVGGVFLFAGAASLVAGLLLLGLPPGRGHASAKRSTVGEMVDAVRYLRATPGVGGVALFLVGVVTVGFPYLTFLPTLAEERFDVGATGYGLMSAVAGAGALLAGTIDAQRNRGLRPWMTITVAAVVTGASTIGLGLAPTFSAALVALAGIGAGGLVFQTSAQALMLRLSAFEYHGRLQSFAILGFSGFGLAALPLGLLADAWSLGGVMVAMGVIVLAMATAFAMSRWRLRRRAALVGLG